MKEAPTFDSYRTAYVAARWDVSDNCAKALQLFEIGFTISGAAQHLPVTAGTVKSYHEELMDKIHPNVVFAVTPSKTRFDVYGKRQTAEQYKTWGKGEGHAHGVEARARDANAQVTDRKEQLDPQFRQRELPVNKGGPLHEMHGWVKA